MTVPQLVVIAGPLKGSVVGLEAGELSVGRLSSNQLFVDDPALSRHHCVLISDGVSVTLRDLDSSHGSFVGDVPVKERGLAHGDTIRLGSSLFLFLDRGHAESVGRALPTVEDRPIAAGTTVELRPEDAAYLRVRSQPAAAGAGDPSPTLAARRAAHLQALVTLGSTLMPLRDAGQVHNKLLRLVVDILPAARAAVLTPAPRGDLQVSATLDPRPASPFELDRTLAAGVIRDGVARLATKTGNPRVPSALCAPLPGPAGPAAAIYATSAERAFDEEDLQFLCAAAGIAAAALHNVGHVTSLEREADILRAEAGRDRRLIGESAAMRLVDGTIAKVSASDSTVLIQGETGTGKELVARAIHDRSARARHPFLAINCAALPKDLVENELFGHEPGAFADARTLRKGILEAADRGTVFLDEIGELPLDVQPKLLRVLQEREFQRLGGTTPVRVNIRVIAATNRDLKKAVQAGTFRDDLFYRLGIGLTVPPLRERDGDIPLLARYFLQKHSRHCGRPIGGIAPDALVALLAYDWPGNVRELENVIERAVVLGSSNETLLLEDLLDDVREANDEVAGSGGEFHRAIRAAKKDAVQRALTRTDYDYSKAARWLGIHVNALHRLIKVLGIPKKSK